MQKTNNRPTSFDALPTGLKPDDIAAVLGISRAHAYNLVRTDGFPRILVGKRIIVPKDAFTRWLSENTVTSERAV